MLNHAHAYMLGGTGAYALYTSRKEDFFEDISIAHINLTGANFTAVISDRPDGTELLTLDVSAVTTETKTYQEWIDDCVISVMDIPCSYDTTDSMIVSTLTISKAQAAIASLPRADTLGGQARFFWSLLQTSPSLDMIAAGEFILTETA